MGLDSFFFKKILEEPKGFPEHNLYGSGGGNPHFRGEAYYNFIEEISGESLFTEEGDSDFINTIVDALENVEFTESTCKAYNILPEEIDDLKKVFRYAKDNNLTYIGSW